MLKPKARDKNMGR
ncbi:hypothetical protein IEO21_04775 [Rhodonia placenta]|uniref:Uncharacterized protein n=1 Tax=Rhodonia placenta TaxID=104341 RepID=A0A8H7P396_9APHY|nr:hypothetical protein IEO21_04775 [Postia placenta]